MIFISNSVTLQEEKTMDGSVSKWVDLYNNAAYLISMKY